MATAARVGSDCPGRVKHINKTIPHITMEKEVCHHEASIALSALACIHHKEGKGSFAYVSGPMQSGKTEYAVMEKYGAKTRAELKQKARDPKVNVKEIIIPNAKALREFAKTVARRTTLPVANPSDFHVRNWEDNEDQYLAVWIPFVEKHAAELHMIDGWNYSTGATMEFLTFLEKQKSGQSVKIYDHEGKEIDAKRGLELVQEGIENIRTRGFHVEKLEKAYEKLKETVRK